VDGGIHYFELFDQHQQNKRFLMAEIKHCCVKLPATNSKKKAVSNWQELNETELRHELRDHERARLEKEEYKVFANAKDVKYLKPLSDKSIRRRGSWILIRSHNTVETKHNKDQLMLMYLEILV
jgi:hypothetical protein